MRKIKFFSFLIAIVFVPLCGWADESDIYTANVNPHVLIILDMSSSMTWKLDGTRTNHDSEKRITMAKNAIKAVLDADGNDEIKQDDQDALKIDFGYMKFEGCKSTNLDSCISVRQDIGTSYSTIWETIDSDVISYNIGYTPLASALQRAKSYFDKYSAPGKECTKKFVILVTDGNDTLACPQRFFWSPSETESDQYKRRRASVNAAKALKDAGIPVFVLGFAGDLVDVQKNTLNWMAYHGGTDNLGIDNTPSPLITAYEPVANPCAQSSTTGYCDGDSIQCFAAANDPGNIALGGYAFMTSDAAALKTALEQVFRIIRVGSVAFTQPSVQSVQLSDEDQYVYVASFEPKNESFWPGHLKKFQISDNLVIGEALADAGSQLESNSLRKMYTYVTVDDGGSVVEFTKADVQNFLNTADPDAVVGYMRGEDSDYNPHSQKKLGDIYHSSPVLVGRPNPFFIDFLDTNLDANGKRGFDLFRDSVASREKVIFAGTNHAQLHAFKTSDMSEAWSFIPPNFLGRLKDLQHSTDPAPESNAHQYFLDGPISAADIWYSTDSAKTGASKAKDEWRTYLIFGEGRGGAGSLWSSSVNCDSGFSADYSAETYPYYCGYYALDVTDPTAEPQLKWILHPGAEDAPYFGEPRGKPAIGRVVDAGKETWVGFLGGGYSKGKGFFTVKMSDGDIVWRKTGTTYDFVATPLLIDTDKDGFIDRVYAADLGGNIWRFNLCKKTDDVSCSISGNWSGGIFFQGSGSEKIFTALSAAWDQQGRLWLYWGTGNKENPSLVVSGYQNKIYGVQDENSDSALNIENLGIVSSYKTNPSGYNGWYHRLEGSGEKMISDPVVFKNKLYFTAYTPPAEGADICDRTGTSKLYYLDYLNGQGSCDNLGSGLASSVVIVTGKKDAAFMTMTSGGGKPEQPKELPSSGASMTKIMYWRDNRLYRP